jgi:uncharacterized repeat protein (TIGR01451 family)
MRAVGPLAVLAGALIAVQGAQGGHAASSKPKHADLGISLVSSPNVAGPNATYRLLVTNKGPNKATGVGVDFVVPDGMTVVPSRQCRAVGTFGSCKIGSLGFARGKVLPVTLSAPAGGFGLVRFYVYGNMPDPHVGSNLIDQVIAVERPPALADLGVSIERGAPDPGFSAPHFVVRITNHGPGDALRTLVRYELQRGVYFGGGNIGSTISCGTSGVSDDSGAQFTDLSFAFGLDKPRSAQFCVPRIAAGETRTFDIALGSILYWETAPWNVHVASLTQDPNSANNSADGEPIGPGDRG